MWETLLCVCLTKFLIVFCYRVMQVSYKGDITYQDIPGYEYGLSVDALHSDSPEESCFCVKQTKDVNGSSSCFLDGVMDLYPCLGNDEYLLTCDCDFK